MDGKKQLLVGAGGQSTGFPDDLVREVLLKLPSLKSTVRLSCVCKSWRDLLTKDPLLREALFNRIDPNCADDPLMVFYKDPDNRYYQIRTHTSQNCFGRLNFSSDLYGIVGSCNGIICLRQLSVCKSNYLFQLYNPITREYRKLPPSSIPHWFHHQGFGFDICRNDFKVVSIHGVNKAEVYKLSTNCWSEVSLNLRYTAGLDSLSPSCVYVNGYCYWKLGGMILTFDFQTETFGLINLPRNPLDCYYGLGVRDDSLALCRFIKSNSNSSETVIEVLIQRGRSWVKKFSIDSVDLVSCWVQDTKLFQFKSNGEVITLRINEGGGDSFAKTGLFRYDWPHSRSIIFRPSLVSLRSGCFIDL